MSKTYLYYVRLGDNDYYEHGYWDSAEDARNAARISLRPIENPDRFIHVDKYAVNLFPIHEEDDGEWYEFVEEVNFEMKEVEK